METLRELYYSPATGFISAEKLYLKAKPLDSSITRKLVKEFLSRQETQQIHKERRKKAHYPLTAYQPFQRLQIDLLDLSNENPNQNKGTKFLFLSICVYSRFVHAEPVKSKSEAECSRAFSAILSNIRTMGYQPQQIDSDSEAAFKSHSFTAFCQDNNITQNFSQIGDHASLGVIDRFCRTLRNYISRYQTARQTQRYIDVLPDLIQNYNSTIHTTLKQSPLEAINFGGISSYIQTQTAQADKVSHNKTTYNIGDKVRLLIKKTTFEKGTSRFTKSTHQITSMNNALYYVSDRVNGYRKSELQLVTGSVETAPNIDEPPDLEERKQAQVIERRITRRMAKEGIEANIAPPPTDDEKSLRAIRRKPVNRPFMISE